VHAGIPKDERDHSTLKDGRDHSTLKDERDHSTLKDEREHSTLQGIVNNQSLDLSIEACYPWANWQDYSCPSVQQHLNKGHEI